MIYKQYKDLKLSALGFGAMRLPWMNDNSGRVDQEAVEKMIDYVQEEDICRSSYLLDYFGQEDSKPCTNCDVCRARPQSNR